MEEISQQKNAAKDNSLDTEVAYLIHEGMFISDAFSESELTPIAIDTTSQRNASPNNVVNNVETIIILYLYFFKCKVKVLSSIQQVKH